MTTNKKTTKTKGTPAGVSHVIPGEDWSRVPETFEKKTATKYPVSTLYQVQYNVQGDDWSAVRPYYVAYSNAMGKAQDLRQEAGVSTRVVRVRSQVLDVLPRYTTDSPAGGPN